ncbi:MAG: hypothetical protein H6922_02075 [Pseudomonadaceae bacterium]|nr:hypothetical protein [Pseudomonadaceae bacterium]
MDTTPRPVPMGQARGAAPSLTRRHLTGPLTGVTLRASSFLLTGATVAALLAVPLAEYQRRNMRITVKPEASQAIQSLTSNYVKRGTTRWACKYGRKLIQSMLDTKFHPAIDVGCHILRDLPRLESQRLLKAVNTMSRDGTLDVDEIDSLRNILATNNVKVHCPSLETALAPLDDNKPSVALGKKVARAVTHCPAR